MKSRTLLITLLGILFIAGSALVLLLKKPICIDSVLVEKIDRIAAQGMTSVQSCAANIKIPFEQKMNEAVKEISRRVSSLEPLLDSRSIEIIWLDERSKTVRIQGKKIFISEDALFGGNALEDAIVRIFLREKAKETIIDNTLIESALVDIYLQSAAIRIVKDEEAYGWPASLRMVEDKLSTESLREFVGEILIQAWKKISLHERENILKTIPELLDSLGLGQLQTNEITNIVQAHQEVAQVMNLLIKFSQTFNNLNQKQAWINFSESILSSLKKRGFVEGLASVKFDNIIIMPDELTGVSEKIVYLNKSNEAKKSVAIFDSKNVWVLPSVNSFTRHFFNKYWAHQALLLSCKTPTVKEILDIASATEKLLYVDYCNNFSRLNYRDYFSHGYEGFAKNNQKISFIEIHIPSLLQVWKNKAINPLLLIKKQDWKNPFFKALGWRPPLWDADLKIYRTQTAIQAIEAYRWNDKP